MKKILSLVLAAMMIFSVLPAAFAAETAVAAEVSEDVVEAITLLNDLGIYKGYENGDMGADDLVQRYQMSIFATRFKSGRVDDKIWATTENDSGFTDVVDFAGASDYVLGMISYAAQAGIVNGTGDNKFEPTMYVKYKEAITMVVRALGQVYSAASYPWAYIQFANDAGLLDGIDTDIAPDDYVSRGVIAQLLYNALFVELVDEDGKDIPTVAEKNFGVGYTTVMVTASNDIVYEAGAAKVLKDGYVRFAEIDVQGEPTGADYHAVATLFGLNDVKAENRAVGTLYNVYYKNNFADLLSVESLAVTYQNRGWDKLQVKYSNANNNIYKYDQLTFYNNKDQYVTIDGTKYQVVSQYTDLKKYQGATSNAAGTPEMKVFTEIGAAKATQAALKPDFILSNDGLTIYKVGQQMNFFAPYATYSQAIGKWYGKDDNGNWKIFANSDLFNYTPAKSDLSHGFAKKTDATLASAYADVTVSANERMTVRQYQFGYITFTTNTRATQYSSTPAVAKTFTLQRNTAKTTVTSSSATWEYDQTPYMLYTQDVKNTDNSVIHFGVRPVNNELTQYINADGTYSVGTEYFVDEYAWTGIPASSLKDGYIIYYVNHETREIEVLETITDANDGDDSYIIKNTYIRGFDLASDSITVGADYTTYKYDYNDLAGAPLRGKANHSSSSTANNFAYLNPLFNIPVDLVVVDGKVVLVKEASTNDFVIIDSFVSFEEDGIIANAWSTVENGYTQIKIGSFNGWSVGGIDYWYYIFGSWTGSSAALSLPFGTRELYKVVSTANGVYDLTDMFNVVTGNGTAAVNVIKEGYIENVDKANNAIVAGKFTPTTDGDYWMVLDEYNTVDGKPQVYSLNGKINPISFSTGADFYKANGDYVIVVDADREISNTNFLTGSVAFYKYNKQVNLYDNENYLVSNTFNTYNYSLYMVNVLTGKTESVQLANDSILGVGSNGGYNAYAMYQEIVAKEGAIFMAENGVIKSLETWTEPMVAAYLYQNDAAYKLDENLVGIAGVAIAPGSTAVDVLDIVNAAMVDAFYSNATNSIGYFDANITVYFKKNTKAATTYSSFKGDVAGRGFVTDAYNVNGNVKALNGLLANTGDLYEVYFAINEDTKTAVAWVIDTGKAPTARKTATADASTSTFATAPDMTVSYDRVSGKMTVAIAHEGLAFVAGDKVTLTVGSTAYEATSTTVASDKLTAASWTIAIAEADFDALAQVKVDFDRASGDKTATYTLA